MANDPLDTRVTNGRFVVPGESALTVLTIHEGRVIDDDASDVWRNVDASGHLVFPGLIQTGTSACNAALGLVRGGVTSVVDTSGDVSSACLDVITDALNGLPIIQPGSEGRLSDANWNALLGDDPVHFDGGDTEFPVIHFLYHEGHRRRGMSLKRICDLTSGNIARAAGIYPQKGTFDVGTDGDLFVFDAETPDPYRGIGWPGRVIFSLLRGQILLYNGQIHTNSGDGHAIA